MMWEVCSRGPYPVYREGRVNNGLNINRLAPPSHNQGRNILASTIT